MLGLMLPPSPAVVRWSHVPSQLVHQISLCQENLVIGSMYRPPNTKANVFVDEYSEILCTLKHQKYKNIAIGFDQNLDLLKSHCHGYTERFLQTNLEHMMIPTITEGISSREGECVCAGVMVLSSRHPQSVRLVLGKTHLFLMRGAEELHNTISIDNTNPVY